MNRGEILLFLRILDRRNIELERMNAGNEGGRYVYPEIFIRLLGYMRMLFHLPYRQTEGFLKTLRKFDSRISADYSTIDTAYNKQLKIQHCSQIRNNVTKGQPSEFDLFYAKTLFASFSFDSYKQII